LETPEDYSESLQEAIKAIINEREISQEALETLAHQYNQKIVRAKMEKLNPANDEINVHKSYFLSEEIIRNIYLEELKSIMDRKDGFRYDPWIYAIGG